MKYLLHLSDNNVESMSTIFIIVILCIMFIFLELSEDKRNHTKLVAISSFMFVFLSVCLISINAKTLLFHPKNVRQTVNQRMLIVGKKNNSIVLSDTKSKLYKLSSAQTKKCSKMWKLTRNRNIMIKYVVVKHYPLGKQGTKYGYAPKTYMENLDFHPATYQNDGYLKRIPNIKSKLNNTEMLNIH